MNELSKLDVDWVLRSLKSDVKELLIAHTGRLFLAGGMIRASIAREDVHDIDILATDKALATAAAMSLANKRGDDTWTSENAVTVKSELPVQFVHRWTFTSPRECIESFDFTIACAAVWYEDGAWRSACDPGFYPDLAAKRLVYRSPVREEAAGGSLLRVLKFYRRGYLIPLDSLSKVIARATAGIDTTTPEASSAILMRLYEVDPSAMAARVV